MTLEQVREALKDRKPRAVAFGAGLSYQTVYAIQTGREGRQVSYLTVKALSDYLTEQQKEIAGVV